MTSWSQCVLRDISLTVSEMEIFSCVLVCGTVDPMAPPPFLLPKQSTVSVPSSVVL